MKQEFMPAAVILDRDGVINYDSIEYIKSLAEWRPLPGSLRAIARLNAKNIKVFVATNQSGIGRGYFSERTLAQMHQKMHTLLQEYDGHIDGVFYCTHTPAMHCACRKPAIGLLTQITQSSNIALPDMIFIGDSYSDYGAAVAANCASFFLVLTGKGRQTLARLQQEHATELQQGNIKIAADLEHAVAEILKHDSITTGSFSV